MTKLNTFDVLIVYSGTLAKSASDSSVKNITPFSKKSPNYSYNLVYGYFLDTCAEHKLTAAFTTSTDIIGPGFCRSFWKFENHQWIKVANPCYSRLIFDKFSPTNNRKRVKRELLFSDPNIKPFNHPQLYDLFFDKQLTFDKFSQHAIPTVSVGDNTLENISHACQNLVGLMSKNIHRNDFSSDVIMKDKFGAGGRHVYKFKANDCDEMLTAAQKTPEISYIVQPFAKYNATDIRLIYLGGQIVQSYIRVAKTGEFRCNEHCGGLLTYLPLSEIPTAVVTKSNQVAESLNKKYSLFTLDFIVSDNGNPYLLEGNTGPGLDWNTSLPQNEIEAKKLIQLVVTELSSRSGILINNA